MNAARAWLFALALVLVSASHAAAGNGWGWGGGWGGPWGNYYGYYQDWRIGSGAVGAPPYFALYPPVYYSPQIIRRAYGFSPFAHPAVIPNQSAPAPEPPSLPEPKLIINPYVKQPAGNSQTSLERQQPVDATTADGVLIAHEVRNPFAR